MVMFKYKKEIVQMNDAGLPKTRRELFKQIMKRDFALVADCSLLNFLFSLVLYGAFIFEYMLLTRLENMQYNDMFQVLFYGGLIAIAGFMLRAVGRTGNYGVLVKRAFNEGCLVGAQFKRSVKENCGSAVVFGLITGVSYLIMTCGSLHYMYNSDNSVAKGFGIGICVLQFMVVFLASEYAYCEQQVYELPKAYCIRNGVLFTFMSFLPEFAWFTADMVLPFALCLLPLPVPAFVLVVWGTLVNGILQLAGCLFALDRFDKHINAANYPDRVGRGLAKNKNGSLENGK